MAAMLIAVSLEILDEGVLRHIPTVSAEILPSKNALATIPANMPLREIGTDCSNPGRKSIVKFSAAIHAE